MSLYPLYINSWGSYTCIYDNYYKSILKFAQVCNNILVTTQIIFNLLLKHLYKNKINILALLLMLKYKCNEQ